MPTRKLPKAMPNTNAWPMFHNTLHDSHENAEKAHIEQRKSQNDVPNDTMINSNTTTLAWTAHTHTQHAQPSGTMCIRHGIIQPNCELRHLLTTYTVSPSRPDGNIHDPTCAAKVTLEHTRRLSLSLNDKPRLTAQVPTTHEWNTASLQLSTRRQERTPIDTTLSLTCKRCVGHRICSRCSGLHPRFDHSCSNIKISLLQTASLASLQDQTVIVESRALTETAQHEKLQAHRQQQQWPKLSNMI